MINTLTITNFKSVKQLNLNCKRINIFIGEPNTGKANILETIGFFSFEGYAYRYRYEFKDFVRLERTSQIFYDENIDEEMEISFDDKVLKVAFRDGVFSGHFYQEGNPLFSFSASYQTVLPLGGHPSLIPFKFYRFAVKESFPRREADFLLPPSGDNLLSLLLAKKEIRSLANELFAPFGLRLGLRPQENKIEVMKTIEEDVIISHPYPLSSDTLQRTIFYLVAVLSNRDSILAFEEPEAHSFPYYTKYLAEVIALEQNNNQYFISTHNPYFLHSVLEKSPQEDIAVFMT